MTTSDRIPMSKDGYDRLKAQLDKGIRKIVFDLRGNPGGSLDEAVRHLEGDPGLVPVAGCTDLMVRGPEALHRMDRVIDLLRIVCEPVTGAISADDGPQVSPVRSEAPPKAVEITSSDSLG